MMMPHGKKSSKPMRDLWTVMEVKTMAMMTEFRVENKDLSNYSEKFAELLRQTLTPALTPAW